MDEGVLIMSGLKPKNVLKSIEIVTSQNNSEINMVEDYKTNNFSIKIVRVILSYIEYINSIVWRKNFK